MSSSINYDVVVRENIKKSTCGVLETFPLVGFFSALENGIFILHPTLQIVQGKNRGYTATLKLQSLMTNVSCNHYAEMHFTCAWRYLGCPMDR